MSDLFASPEMAAAYATVRPPVHPRIIERIRERLRLEAPVGRALDIGCGAGLSTRALAPIARNLFGIDPFEAMLAWSARTAPGAHFAAAKAEALPFRTHSMDLIAAAGSLDFADLDLFLPEAQRILRPEGYLVIYDFSEGRRFRDSDSLETWYAEFQRRYPPPPPCGQDVAARLNPQDRFEVGLTLTLQAYVDYVMSETNVAQAVRAGTPAASIRAWCEATLTAVFAGAPREVLFPCYLAEIRGQATQSPISGTAIT